MKKLLFIFALFGSLSVMGDELDFDEPCSEQGAYTVQAEGIRFAVSFPMSYVQDEEVVKKVEKLKAANLELAASMDKYCEVMNSLEARLIDE
jgi:hypothetical protein